MKVIWASGAVRSLVAIRHYISVDDPVAAGHVAAKIKAAVKNLETFPHAGRPGVRENTRELVIGGLPYVVVYRVGDSAVYIARVLHTSRHWQEGAWE
ncbi:Toxin RelE2 [Caulifigura coniformis]|uniref:Toxin RelE2 n=1 Tax=Caulifigura coniformis TaxID=2527983 RepID=A0A517SCM6_9PLAN|nr:type II toxin-antitoxin system RelE/ParE family toxin [Caulifigura coniformis]QDT53865.1 Toxin RelE2 [Caulifigura coniformis]